MANPSLKSDSNLREITRVRASQKALAAFNKAYALTDYKKDNNLDKRFEFRKGVILRENINKNAKDEAIELLTQRYNYDKIIFNEGARRKCQNCQKECLATLYCELCVRNHLIKNFKNWTSENDEIDNLIRKCQMETIGPNKIIEWISYDNLEDIKYLSSGGISEVYSAVWTCGHYNRWNSEKQQLERYGPEKVVLKRLENVENADRSWFDEAKSHLTISNKWAGITQCYGLTYDRESYSYMLVMCYMSKDLRTYLQQNHGQLKWSERIKINVDIIDSLLRIHKEYSIHRDLHSGNILYSEDYNYWYISDLGFCGPVDKPLKSVYGNLPYIAPEVMVGREYDFASDIYSIGILMWEISAGRLPHANHVHDVGLVMNIINGMRPKIVSGTPQNYKELMIQCWDANPSKRPGISELHKRITELNKSHTQNSIKDRFSFLKVNDSKKNKDHSNLSSNYTGSQSKVHRFDQYDKQVPKNATEVEQEAFHSKVQDFSIPNTPINSKVPIDTDDSKNQAKSTSQTKSGTFTRGISGLSKMFKKFTNDDNENSRKGKSVIR